MFYYEHYYADEFYHNLLRDTLQPYSYNELSLLKSLHLLTKSAENSTNIFRASLFDWFDDLGTPEKTTLLSDIQKQL